jgi:hypothetical protein
MANGLSDIATRQATPDRTGTISGAKLMSPVKHARFEITLLGNEQANEWHTLGRLNESGYQVIPEQCRIRHISGTYSLVSKIRRVNAAGTASDVSAGLTHAQNTSAASNGLQFAATANTEPATLDSTDTLQLQMTTVTTTNAGAKFVVEIGYRTVEA